MVLKQMERWIGDGPKRTSQLTTHESPLEKLLGIWAENNVISGIH